MATRLPLPLAIVFRDVLKLGQPSKFEKYRDELAQMMGEGIAKKEMSRRTRLSLTSVKK